MKICPDYIVIDNISTNVEGLPETDFLAIQRDTVFPFVLELCDALPSASEEIELSSSYL